MRYFRVKPEYDQATKYFERPDHKLRSVGILVGNELYTPAERAKIMNGAWMFEEVEIPKSQVYFFFGARFENGTEYADAKKAELDKIKAELKRGESMQAQLAFYND